MELSFTAFSDGHRPSRPQYHSEFVPVGTCECGRNVHARLPTTASESKEQIVKSNSYESVIGGWWRRHALVWDDAALLLSEQKGQSVLDLLLQQFLILLCDTSAHPAKQQRGKRTEHNLEENQGRPRERD